jgi:hypothetical protein
MKKFPASVLLHKHIRGGGEFGGGGANARGVWGIPEFLRGRWNWRTAAAVFLAMLLGARKRLA